jgi:hypothetical protein
VRDDLNHAHQIILSFALKPFERACTHVQVQMRARVLRHASVRLDSLAAPALVQKSLEQKASRRSHIQHRAGLHVARHQAPVFLAMSA